MAAKYTAGQRAESSATGQPLATIAVAGLEFCGVVTPAEQKEIVSFWLAFQERRAARLASEPKEVG